MISVYLLLDCYVLLPLLLHVRVIAVVAILAMFSMMPDAVSKVI